VTIDHFEDPSVKQLAEVYWSHQRDEGEPVFNEFLAFLPSPELKELAVTLLGEFEEQAQAELEKGLNDAIDNLIWERTAAERRQRQAAIGAEGSDEVEQLRRLTELARASSQRNSNV
jgi:hypothetical protein